MNWLRRILCRPLREEELLEVIQKLTHERNQASIMGKAFSDALTSKCEELAELRNQYESET